MRFMCSDGDASHETSLTLKNLLCMIASACSVQGAWQSEQLTFKIKLIISCQLGRFNRHAATSFSVDHVPRQPRLRSACA